MSKRKNRRFKSQWIERGILCLFLATVFPACFGTDDQDTAEKWQDRDRGLEDRKREIKKLENELRFAVKDLRCELSSHCDVRSMGPETCGKRSQFVVFSVKGADTGEVERLLNRYNELSDEINRSSFKVLSCGKTPPRALCVDRMCIAEGYQMPKAQKKK